MATPPGVQTLPSLVHASGSLLRGGYLLSRLGGEQKFPAGVIPLLEGTEEFLQPPSVRFFVLAEIHTEEELALGCGTGEVKIQYLAEQTRRRAAGGGEGADQPTEARPEKDLAAVALGEFTDANSFSGEGEERLIGRVQDEKFDCTFSFKVTGIRKS